MDYSRAIQNDNSQGGSGVLYIFPFVEYSSSQITVVNNFLTAFPYNIIYNLEAFNITFDEDVSEFYEQKCTFQVKKILAIDKFKEYAQRDYRIILKDNNGNLRILGAHTGVQGKFTKSTGGNLADFNGYNFTYDTKEEDTAPFLTDLSLFNVMPFNGLNLQDGNGNLIQDNNDNLIVN